MNLFGVDIETSSHDTRIKCASANRGNCGFAGLLGWINK